MYYFNLTEGTTLFKKWRFILLQPPLRVDNQPSDLFICIFLELAIRKLLLAKKSFLCRSSFSRSQRSHLRQFDFTYISSFYLHLSLITLQPVSNSAGYCEHSVTSNRVALSTHRRECRQQKLQGRTNRHTTTKVASTDCVFYRIRFQGILDNQNHRIRTHAKGHVHSDGIAKHRYVSSSSIQGSP